MERHSYSHAYQSIEVVSASPEALFAYADDHARLSSHMSKRSSMMAGGSMTIECDSANGKAIGSKIALHGTVLGLSLEVQERVTERQPPLRKVWQTEGEPRLLVIGPYQMGFELTPVEHSTSLRVFIEYSLPKSGWGRVLGVLFAGLYARWCTMRMAKDAARHFATVRE